MLTSAPGGRVILASGIPTPVIDHAPICTRRRRRCAEGISGDSRGLVLLANSAYMLPVSTIAIAGDPSAMVEKPN